MPSAPGFQPASSSSFFAFSGSWATGLISGLEAQPWGISLVPALALPKSSLSVMALRSMAQSMAWRTLRSPRIGCGKSGLPLLGATGELWFRISRSEVSELDRSRVSAGLFSIIGICASIRSQTPSMSPAWSCAMPTSRLGMILKKSLSILTLSASR